ncbi:thiamine pyrophosphate-dependent enzyme [Pantoea sp. RRHST58]|uniref:thiamine pyrophosphate-dependent enzyme n=1 Tax=Pantoea sp. RRHST58 TaxID=3425183 RepID=UPI003DA0A541
MAAHLVYPDRPVIAVCGDGGFMMNSPEQGTRPDPVRAGTCIQHKTQAGDYLRIKASRSALITSAWVVCMPCG